MLLSQQFDAVVAFPAIARHGREHCAAVTRGVPSGRRAAVGRVEVSKVLVTNFPGAYDAVRHLIELGHRR
jgi:DNA-binding LacI/PurR family transcriptional regulator